MRRLASAAAILLVALTGVGCTAETAPSSSTIDSQDAIDDALGAPVNQVFFAQVASSWAQMQSEADTGCLQEITGGTYDRALFDTSATSFTSARAGLVALDRPAPAGYPEQVPDFGDQTWCEIASTLKSAKL